MRAAGGKRELTFYKNEPMKTKIGPEKALEVVVGLLGRLSLSPVEYLGAQECVEVLKGAVVPNPPDRADAPKPETISPE